MFRMCTVQRMESIEKIIGSQLKTNSKIIIKQKEGKGVFPSH